MKRIVMMGPPGVGKGTQSAKLSAHLKVSAVSTGDMFRAHLREQTAVGRKLAALVAAGDLIPDEITNTMVAQRLAEPDVAAGFILDGYPRTTNQVRELDVMLDARAHAVDVAILLVADEAEIVRRLTMRASSEGRTDDTPEVIRHRVALYHRETSPLAEVYRERGILVTIDGIGHPAEINQRITAALA